MFVFTFVAGLFTFQYDKPHFDPLPRLPPNRARTHTDSPVMSRSSFCHVGDSITIFSVCVGCASRFHHRGKSLSYRTPRRVNPPNLPFYCGGVSPPFPLAAYAAATGGLQERLALKFSFYSDFLIFQNFRLVGDFFLNRSHSPCSYI